MTTTNDSNVAKKIANHLLKAKLSKCAQISRVTSIYSWHESIKEDAEYKIEIKSTVEDVEEIKLCILKMHNYDLPEVIVMDIKGGSDEYISWLRA
jgi:periplasmic divalent cation tolerance protein